MQLTSEHLIGADNSGPEKLSFIDSYAWQSSLHMKEAVKILLSARLESVDGGTHSRFEGEMAEIKQEVQLRLASNPESSGEVLEYLARHADSRVCERIAGNPSANRETLEILSKHPDHEVRATLSENPQCCEKILYKLLRDGHPDVRLRLAENPDIPANILQELCEDENPFVADRAIQTLRRSDGCVLLSADFGAPYQRSKLKAVN